MIQKKKRSIRRWIYEWSVQGSGQGGTTELWVPGRLAKEHASDTTYLPSVSNNE